MFNLDPCKYLVKTIRAKSVNFRFDESETKDVTHLKCSCEIKQDGVPVLQKWSPSNTTVHFNCYQYLDIYNTRYTCNGTEELLVNDNGTLNIEYRSLREATDGGFHSQISLDGKIPTNIHCKKPTIFRRNQPLTSPSVTINTSTSAKTPSPSSGISQGAIIGISVVAAVLFIVCLLLCFILIYKYRKEKVKKTTKRPPLPPASQFSITFAPRYTCAPQMGIVNPVGPEQTDVNTAAPPGETRGRDNPALAETESIHDYDYVDHDQDHNYVNAELKNDHDYVNIDLRGNVKLKENHDYVNLDWKPKKTNDSSMLQDGNNRQ
ncbi:uncharacterized protein LOC141900600 [Tubulanus polymorphus]|uniref:uncharacterized protein LOC141900600 n=1 Tax=Tubulanus polymorphus TaxID=672921 RepID=UPI003DA6854E